MGSQERESSQKWFPATELIPHIALDLLGEIQSFFLAHCPPKPYLSLSLPYNKLYFSRDSESDAWVRPVCLNRLTHSKVCVGWRRDQERVVEVQICIYLYILVVCFLSHVLVGFASNSF